MRVFVTGATGFIGTSVVSELLGAGHQVLALARSDRSAEAAQRAGAEVLRGSIEDLQALRAGALDSQGVIHLAFNHDFSRFVESAAEEASALQALAEALEGSGNPLLVTSGTLGQAPGRVATETDASGASPRHAGIRAALSFVERGVRTVVVRNAPLVHGSGDERGFVAHLVAVARTTGVAAYIGDGSNRWPAVHRSDAARLYRLALDEAEPGAVVHAVRDEGIQLRVLAEGIGRHLGVPVASLTPADALAHFGGFFATILALDSPASSAGTREMLGWSPDGQGLLEDLEEGHYFVEAAVDG